MAIAKIIWVDDEIESLQSQKLFLENKGYEVQSFTNGFDAIDFVKENLVDVVLIDETMPGITGLETLAKIKEINQALPVVLTNVRTAANAGAPQGAATSPDVAPSTKTPATELPRPTCTPVPPVQKPPPPVTVYATGSDVSAERRFRSGKGLARCAGLFPFRGHTAEGEG